MLTHILQCHNHHDNYFNSSFNKLYGIKLKWFQGKNCSKDIIHKSDVRICIIIFYTSK